MLPPSASAALVLSALAIGACGESKPDACDALKPRFMTMFEQHLRESVERGPRGGGGFGGMFEQPGAPSPADRELAHVRAHFVGACREVGAPELTRCLDLEEKRRALPRDQRPADDDACRRLDNTLEAALYRGYGP